MFFWCIRGLDEDNREQFLAMLEAPLPWQTPEKVTDTQVEQESEDFMDFLTAMQGPVTG